MLKILVDCMVGKRRIQLVEDLGYDDFGFGDRYELLVNHQFEISGNSMVDLFLAYGLPLWILDDYKKELD